MKQRFHSLTLDEDLSDFLLLQKEFQKEIGLALPCKTQKHCNFKRQRQQMKMNGEEEEEKEDDEGLTSRRLENQVNK